MKIQTSWQAAAAIPDPDVSRTKRFREQRQRLLEWIRHQLVGPVASSDVENELLATLPTTRFPCGALYPISRSGDGLDPVGEEKDDLTTSPEGTSESAAEPGIVRRYMPPSSLGLSFFVRGPDIRFQVLCRAAHYQIDNPKSGGQFSSVRWRRFPSGPDGEEYVANLTIPRSGLAERQEYKQLFEDRARLDVLWRPFADGWIVTTSLCNTQEMPEEKSAREHVQKHAKLTLFEAGLRCVIDSGEVGAYPAVDRALLNDEEQEIELRYASRHIYAVGHGCAADWTFDDGRVIECRSETMPTVEVPQMISDTGSTDDPVLSLALIADMDCAPSSEAQAHLLAFVESYARWVVSRGDDLRDLNPADREAGGSIVERMKTAVARMREGLRLLERDDQVRVAFALANRAMLDQMRQSDRIGGGDSPDDAYRWRPFQLAFLLTTLESTANADSEFRDIVDLIWFPTGGGKTEAYLGLIAFQIALRRLRHPDTGGGTTVLMRYTLRLLARDQFIRAARLICALELLRRARDDLGLEPVSIGMWVGGATSPNTFQDALKKLDAARASRQERPELVVDACPWCGEDFLTDRNFDCSDRHFGFVCRNAACDFGSSADGVTPCNIVDEALYKAPPTLLVGTVDKFARLAWDERANSFFGGTQHRPPELIIQDELHLIAGALGSVAGLYEAGLDTVLQMRGLYAKYIASTATIRMADKQVKRLYGRDVAVFPPPGLDCDDSYFSRTVPLETRPGRLYIGYLAPLLNRQKCLAPLAAALLVAPAALFKNEQEEWLLDAWWSQVVYHGSLKGVGNSHTAFASDVRDFARLLSAGPGMSAEENVRPPPRIAQLTSLQTAVENSRIFTQLRRSRTESGCLDAVLATNMISVGLDVARLALMTINGQPLTTAEYIQASSRVGRGDVPGVVFANYYRDQAGSLSHYESFRPYHEAFYRFVEPTSVTPYAYQARMRALHAALVIVMRHAGIGLLGNKDAARFDPDAPGVAEAARRLKLRCRLAAGDKADETEHHIDALMREWGDEVDRCREDKRQLQYQAPDREKGCDRLLYNHDDSPPGLWPTLQSFRNVENTALLKAL